MYDYVQSLSLSESDFASEAAGKEFSEKMSRELNHEIESQLNIQLERIYNRIQSQLGKDIEGLESFGNEFNASMQEIQLDIHAEAASSGTGGVSGAVISTIGNTALAAATGYAIPGIGGIITGYQEHGIKGAVVGGISGGLLGAGSIAALTAIGVVGFPLVVAGSIIAAFGGRAVTRFFFGRKEPQRSVTVDLERIRSSIYDSVDQNITNLRSSATVEKWLKETCDELYNKIADDIDREWENSLVTMEQNLSQIRLDLQMSEENRKKTEEDLSEYAAVVGEVVTEITPVYDKLTAALNTEG